MKPEAIALVRQNFSMVKELQGQAYGSQREKALQGLLIWVDAVDVTCPPYVRPMISITEQR